jgi:hypothetical protein
MDRLDAPERAGAACILPASRTGCREINEPGRTAKFTALIGDKKAAHVAMEAAEVSAIRVRAGVRRPTISASGRACYTLFLNRIFTLSTAEMVKLGKMGRSKTGRAHQILQCPDSSCSAPLTLTLSDVLGL